MSRRFALVCSLILAAACQPGDPGMLDPALDHQFRVTEDIDVHGEEAWEIELSTDRLLDFAVGEVKALICIGGHCFWGTIDIQPNGTAILQVPADPALIGLDVVVWVPSTGQGFTGRIR